MRARHTLIIAMLLLALSSCTAAPERTPSPSKVGGMTECTIPAVQPFVTAAVELQDTTTQMPIRDLQCAEGWAVASGIRGPKNPPANGPHGAPTSMLLEAEGQFWIVKDKARVCGTYNPETPTALPKDALVPAALYTSGCLAG